MGSSLTMSDIEDIKLSPDIFINTLYGIVMVLSSLYIGYTLYY